MTLDQIDHLAAEMRPFVENATGVRMVALPRIKENTVAAFNENVLDARARWLTTLSFGYTEHVPKDATPRFDDLMAPSALMVYSNYDRTIHVMQDVWEAAFTGNRAFDGHVDDVLACAMAHELVHATQDQTVALDEGAVALDQTPRRVLAEGVAVVYGLRACSAARGPGALAFSAAQQGVDVALVRPNEGWFSVYGVGAAYVAAIEAEAGRETAWSVLARPPPTLVELGARAAQVLPGVWQGREPLDAVARGLASTRLAVSAPLVLDEPPESVNMIETANSKLL
ncbi:MAG: hypothetical protein V4850_08060 [Myxococcota bacterium]